jgi:sugar (pentulose or hexulose) kinase
VEVDAEEHYRTVCRVLRHLSAHAPGEVIALAMAAASGNTLLTDDDGIPLTPIINWMDQRAEQHPPGVLTAFNSSDVANITGWVSIR